MKTRQVPQYEISRGTHQRTDGQTFKLAARPFGLPAENQTIR
jgi:hypothetical protein